MAKKTTLDPVYDPRQVEPEIRALWEESGAFRSKPGNTPHDRTFTIVIPPPNVTGALHLGHALNNTLQDILIRYHRMRGFNTLWQPGTDHAGIATQAVVERRIRTAEGKSRHDLGREGLVKRIWEWKDEYEKRIISQLKLMGCSCDWERTRFTLDEGLARAVRHQFFKLFKDGLIFRGKRLVNWDTQLQTAVSDDEVYHETVQGHFWHFKYPVIDPKPGEPEHVIIATTRPETMLGDTGVAVNPDPEAFFDRHDKRLGEELASATAKDTAALQAKLDALMERRRTHLAQLVQLRDMANDGRTLRLPLVEREIPLIVDDWADPTKGSGCVKITPAHDTNDYEVGVRHQLPMINVLSPDGTVAQIVEPGGEVNSHSADYEGLPFSTDARAKVVADMEARGLLHEVEEHEVEIGHSDRSKQPIEPYLSDQWFVKTGDCGSALLTLGDGSKSAGLAQAALDAVTEGRITVFPQRYARSYVDWLSEKRDWCISRQLWWGHRIAVWKARFRLGRLGGQSGTRAIRQKQTELLQELQGALNELGAASGCEGDFFVRAQEELSPSICFICTRSAKANQQLSDVCSGMGRAKNVALMESDEPYVEAIALGDPRYDSCRKIRGLINELREDEDVLDTWFSSALWPFSTLGWPEETQHLKQYYPGSVLCTSRDIITNWVARMVMFGLYSIGKIPFDRVYIHPKILDGRGETMSKSKGNGVDPVDIIQTHGTDALRYSMADMCTETQDIRMPVDYICPHCGKLTDQLGAVQTEEQNRKSRGEKLERRLQPADCVRVKCRNNECGWEFATRWADDALKKELKVARETSEKFEIGRNFCNKLWNAARFAFMNLEGTSCEKLEVAALPPEDRWILARLSQTIRRYHECLGNYQFSASVKGLRVFFWESLCDWYIELTKPRMAAPRSDVSGQTAQQVLAFCLDQVLRLFHPTMPFITEHLWRELNTIVPKRGFPPIVDLNNDGPLCLASFPPVEGYAAFDDDAILATFAGLQSATRGVRDLRTACNVPPRNRVMVTVVVPEANRGVFAAHAHILEHMAGIGALKIVTQGKRPRNAGSVTKGTLRIFVHDISDDQAERKRTKKSLDLAEKQIAGKEAKLQNERFLANAKPEFVDAERTRLAELTAERASLREHLAELEA